MAATILAHRVANNCDAPLHGPAQQLQQVQPTSSSCIRLARAISPFDLLYCIHALLLAICASVNMFLACSFMQKLCISSSSSACTLLHAQDNEAAFIRPVQCHHDGAVSTADRICHVRYRKLAPLEHILFQIMHAHAIVDFALEHAPSQPCANKYSNIAPA